MKLIIELEIEQPEHEMLTGAPVHALHLVEAARESLTQYTYDVADAYARASGYHVSLPYARVKVDGGPIYMVSEAIR